MELDRSWPCEFESGPDGIYQQASAGVSEQGFWPTKTQLEPDRSEHYKSEYILISICLLLSPCCGSKWIQVIGQGWIEVFKVLIGVNMRFWLLETSFSSREMLLDFGSAKRTWSSGNCTNQSSISTHGTIVAWWNQWKLQRIEASQAIFERIVSIRIL